MPSVCPSKLWPRHLSAHGCGSIPPFVHHALRIANSVIETPAVVVVDLLERSVKFQVEVEARAAAVARAAVLAAVL